MIHYYLDTTRNRILLEPGLIPPRRREVWIGNKKADFVVKLPPGERYLLVEIERPIHKLEGFANRRPRPTLVDSGPRTRCPVEVAFRPLAGAERVGLDLKHYSTAIASQIYWLRAGTLTQFYVAGRQRPSREEWSYRTRAVSTSSI